MGTHLFSHVPAEQAAADTPADRDRVVDAVRAVSLLIVVAGHGFMAVVGWDQGMPKVGNVLAAYSWAQVVTWVFQIIPLFFFAGGAANTISWDRHVSRGGAFPEWIWSRAQRLLRPVWIYLLVMGVVALFIGQFVSQPVAVPLLFIATQLLWFLGSYLLVTALTPLFPLRSTVRSAYYVLLLIVTCGAVDVLRLLAHLPIFGLLNFVFVWALPAYLGSLRARGILERYSKQFLLTVLFSSVLINVLLIKFGPWPLSLVGMPEDKISNMAPPTIVLALHSIVWICAVTLLNAPLTLLLLRENIWRPITGVNLSAMTLYLWHLPVLTSLLVISHVLGMDRPTKIGRDAYASPDGWGYFVESIPFWFVFALGVWAAVRLLWPIEHIALPWWDSAPHPTQPSAHIAQISVVLGACGAGVGLLMLSATGLGGFPTRILRFAGVPLNSALAIAILVLSGVLIRWAGTARPLNR